MVVHLHTPFLDVSLCALGVWHASGLLNGIRDLLSIQQVDGLRNGQLAILPR